jgi:hypothetical protein
MPVIEGGQVLRGGQDFGGVLGGQVLYGGQEIEPEQGGRTQPDSEAVEMSVGPFRRSGAPPNGWYNGVADKGAIAVDIATGTHYTNTGTKAATVWTVDAASGGGSGWLRATGKIAHAALLTLPTAPVTLVAAQGANTVIVPHRAVLLRVIPTVPYETIDPDAQLQLILRNALPSLVSGVVPLAPLINGGGTGRLDVSTFLGAAAETFALALAPDGIWNADWPGMVYGVGFGADVANTPLELVLDNKLSGNLTAGAVANALCWSVWYSVVSTDPATYS